MFNMHREQLQSSEGAQYPPHRPHLKLCAIPVPGTLASSGSFLLQCRHPQFSWFLLFQITILLDLDLLCHTERKEVTYTDLLLGIFKPLHP